MLLRSVLDVLEGLASLHDLRDSQGQPLGFVHGSLSPDSVLVADDGVAEIAHTCSGPPAKPDRFVAPEARRGERPSDVRADVYSVGAILREVLGSAGPEAKWAEALTDIAWRACSVDPENRWPSAAAMATTLRRVGGSKLATADGVAGVLRKQFGSRIRARRAALDMLDEEAPPSSGEPISVRPSDMMVIEAPSDPTLVRDLTPPPLSKPPVSKAAVARVSLVKKPAAELLDIPEPAVEREAPKGISAIAPPMGMAEAPPPKPSKKPSLPPPDIIVPPERPKPSLPPPDILPEPSATAPVIGGEAAYRARMPTFPIRDEPPKRSPAVQAMAIAAAMVTTFGVGWWLGSTHPPPGQVTQAVCPSYTSPAAFTPTATLTTPMVTPAGSAVAPTPSSPASAVASASASASVPAWAMAPRPPSTWAAPNVPIPATAPVAPTTEGTTGSPTVAATAPTATASSKVPAVPVPPRPPGSAGYVPSEL